MVPRSTVCLSPFAPEAGRDHYNPEYPHLFSTPTALNLTQPNKIAILNANVLSRPIMYLYFVSRHNTQRIMMQTLWAALFLCPDSVRNHGFVILNNKQYHHAEGTSACQILNKSEISVDLWEACSLGSWLPIHVPNTICTQEHAGLFCNGSWCLETTWAHGFVLPKREGMEEVLIENHNCHIQGNKGEFILELNMSDCGL